jgi:hypothetical protein
MNENECGLFTDLSSIIKNAVLDLSGTAAGNLPFVVSTMPFLGLFLRQFLGLFRQHMIFIIICYNYVMKTKTGKNSIVLSMSCAACFEERRPFS